MHLIYGWVRRVLKCLKKLGREQYFNSKSFLDNLNCTPHNDYIYIPHKIITTFLIIQYFYFLLYSENNSSAEKD